MRQLLAGLGLLLALVPQAPAQSLDGTWRSEGYGQDEVAVCYTPLQVVATEPELARRGRTGVIVRKAPSFDAPPARKKLASLGRVIHTLSRNWIAFDAVDWLHRCSVPSR